MLLAHAVTLAEARSYIAALADNARTFDASMEYERVLLQLDSLHADRVPGVQDVPTTAREALYACAEEAIEELINYGADALRIELVLAMLEAARDKDTP